MEEDGGAPGVRVLPEASPEAVGPRLSEGLSAVRDCAASWPWSDALAVAPTEPKSSRDGWIEVRWVDLVGRKSPGSWPWPREATLAAIEQVVTALHADHPLRAVRWSLPSA